MATWKILNIDFMRWRRVGLVLSTLINLVAIGSLATQGLNLGIEFTQESIRQLVEGLGWKASAIFVGLVTFRQFLFLPSVVVLPVGGIVFGAELGTLLGATGMSQAIAIIAGAMGVRFILQTVPFVRWGS